MVKPPRPPNTAEAVRTAVDRTVQATLGQAQVTRERAQELVDELAGVPGRVREALDDLRPVSQEDVKALRLRIEQLEKRLAALEPGDGKSD